MNSTHQASLGSICFYGAGSMAEAIVRGLIHKSVAAPKQISMLNRSNQERLTYLSQQYGVFTGNSEQDKNKYLTEASIIVLAMKPKDAKEALTELGPKLQEGQLIVSLIAGISISTLQQLLGTNAPIARSMPNTSSSIGLGATGLSFSEETTDDHVQQVLSMFQSVGIVSVIPEEQMDILTGVSGSGPAYIYYMIEAMIEAGIEGGLTPDQARNLTVQTVLGAASMMLETGEDPAKLRKDITSPNGSTQAALEVLADKDFTNTVKAAVHRCKERSFEMGQAVKEAL
ncbi:pyrroline-5-carboxylate reductase [Fontibacillus panacisegetis]|uniref:Pyrroline-5-carboxylate reductase n=1 Tax=Fontibacillus panacisegetis TaxID=670482 RepID=A0A1G7KWT8_9BACL|nr:pyrroline-5-carboxylate reductase [Fontibacillus panacisegetis]SDF41665.1 pyrroline-5-carboxylate reductase [Fontibacillus panacisegetis]